MSQKTQIQFIFSIILFSLVLINISSCFNKKTDNTVNDCTSESKLIFEDKELMMVNTVEGFYFLNDEYGMLYPCDLEGHLSQFFADNKDSNGSIDYELYDGLWIKISGGIITKIPRDVNSHLSFPTWYFRNEHLIESTSLYVPNDIIVNIYEVEGDNGLGWAYTIEYNGFTIDQYHIPAVPGFQVFVTEKQATKIAYLVASKLKSETGLPSITVEDLSFFQIEFSL